MFEESRRKYNRDKKRKLLFLLTYPCKLSDKFA